MCLWLGRGQRSRASSVDSCVLFWFRLWILCTGNSSSDPSPFSKQFHSGLTTGKKLHMPPKGPRILLESVFLLKGPPLHATTLLHLTPPCPGRQPKKLHHLGMVARTLVWELGGPGSSPRHVLLLVTDLVQVTSFLWPSVSQYVQ